MSRPNLLPRIVSLAFGPAGIRVELEGGHVFEYRREETVERPSLPPPPPTFGVFGEEVASGPGLARALPRNVIPFRKVAS